MKNRHLEQHLNCVALSVCVYNWRLYISSISQIPVRIDTIFPQIPVQRTFCTQNIHKFQNLFWLPLTEKNVKLLLKISICGNMVTLKA